MNVNFELKKLRENSINSGDMDIPEVHGIHFKPPRHLLDNPFEASK